MANFTETRIQKMITELKDEFGPEIATRELALLELEDLERKGCNVEYGPYCLNCPAHEEDNCPLNDWQKRHPEYANDALAMKIRVLEAGGEEAYIAKLKAQAEAKKKAEEEKLKASDTDMLEAARKLLKLHFTSQVEGKTEANYLEALSDILNAETKLEIEAAFIDILGSKQI
jgi:hypothetical protein